MNEKQIAKILVSKLQDMGFVVHRYDAITTNSIYLKLDYGVCCGIRIADHNGKKKYHYRFNVVKGYCGDKIIYFKNLISYFYTFEELPQLLNMVKNERESKIKKYGFENYKIIWKKKNRKMSYLKDLKW